MNMMNNIISLKSESYVRFRTMQKVPGLQALFVSLSMYLGVYWIFTSIVAMYYLISEPGVSGLEKCLITAGIGFSNLGLTKGCLDIFFRQQKQFSLILAVLGATILAFVTAVVLFLTISKDLLSIQKDMGVFGPEVYPNILTKAIRDIALIINGSSDHFFIILLVAALSLSLAALPLVVVAYYIKSTSYLVFNEYSKILKAIE